MEEHRNHHNRQIKPSFLPAIKCVNEHTGLVSSIPRVSSMEVQPTPTDQCPLCYPTRLISETRMASKNTNEGMPRKYQRWNIMLDTKEKKAQTMHLRGYMKQDPRSRLGSRQVALKPWN